MVRIAHRGAVVSLVLLVILCLVWELWLAPIRPGGSWLALKALFATLPLRGLLHGRRYTFQWSCMFILLYFFEGMMRLSEPFPGRAMAAAEALLAAAFFVCAVYYAKHTAAARPSSVSRSGI